MHDLSSIALQYLKLELDTIINLYKQQEQHNTEKILTEEKFYEETAQNLTPEAKKQFDESFQEEYDKFLRVHPQLIRRTTFLQCYFIFESCLNNYCNLKSQSLELNHSYRSMKNVSGIERAKRFLVKYKKIKEPFNSMEWKEIKAYNSIRNSLVHNNGYIVKSKLQTIPPGFQLTNFEGSKQKFTLDERFVDNIYNTYLSFIKKLEQQ